AVAEGSATSSESAASAAPETPAASETPAADITLGIPPIAPSAPHTVPPPAGPPPAAGRVTPPPVPMPPAPSAVPGVPPPPPPYVPGGMPPRPSKMSRGLLWGIIGALVVVLGGGGGAAAYLLTRGDGDETVTSTTKRVTTTATTIVASSTTSTSTSTTSTTAAPTTTTTVVAGGVPGGTLRVSLIEPAFIDPVNMQDSEGTLVGSCLFDSLLAFDYVAGELLPAAAGSWEANDDGSVWTFHLVEDATFHDGSFVTAADFAYAWNRICDPANGSEISYHLSPVHGYDEMQDGTATELSGLWVMDDYTFQVTLYYPFGDFEYVVAHPALGPVPRTAVEADPAGFAEQPIGNGPFMMDGPWVHDQHINVVRYDGYYGTPAYLGGVEFKIFGDAGAPWLEFQAGNLDFTALPPGEIAAAKAQYGESADGLTVAPGEQVLTGPENAIYYMLLNCSGDATSDPLVRQALSLAIDRQAIADEVFMGTREPATNIVPEGIVGFEDGAWQYCRYDVEAAKAALVAAGHPGGEGLPEIVISLNSGAGHEGIMTMIQADWAAIGVKSVLEGSEWADYLDKIATGDYDAGRLGWTADYPIIDNFIYPLFSRTSYDNYSFYTNRVVDGQIEEARQTVDTEERIAKYQDIVRMIGDDCPVIPLLNLRHSEVGSDRVHDLVLSAQGLLSLETAWIGED
ncbi:MAG: ABC transporter substrate-binding protein, partial [Thermoleophilia bacterium]|nr:ABC transporter substrate-binding protein [Thermoleophilia bacterium]